MSEVATDTLRTAAALGKIFGFGELAAASAANEDALLDALDEASAAQLVRPVEGGDGFAFTHDKIREVLYEEMNPIRRRRLHQRIGEALERMLAAQSASAAAGRARARACACRISRITSRRPATSSARSSTCAGRRTTRIASSRTTRRSNISSRRASRPRRCSATTTSRRSTSRPATCTRRAARAGSPQSVSSAHSRGHTRRPRARRSRSRSATATCREATRAASQLLQEAVAELDPAAQANALAHALALIGRYHHYRAEPRKALEYLERALSLALPQDDAVTLTDIYGYLAGAHQHLVQLDESDRFARAAIALGERKDFPSATALGSEFLAENAHGRGRWDDALRYALRDRDEGRKIGSLARVAWSGFPRTAALHATGRLAEARAEALATHGAGRADRREPLGDVGRSGAGADRGRPG